MKNTNIPTNGNCKAVRDITNNIKYGSMTEVAMKMGVNIASVSYAVGHKGLCKGCRLVLESELYKNSDLLCEEIAKANAREAKANDRTNKVKAKLAAAHELESEIAEFRRWKAEQEAKRKAEEERQRKIAKAKEKVEKYKAQYQRLNAKLKAIEEKWCVAEDELDHLLDMEVK